MNSTLETISPLRQRLLDEMRIRKLGPKTQSGYIRTVSRFYGWLGRSPDTATFEDLRLCQLYLVDHGISPISLNVTITGLKFFFDSTLDRPELMRHMHPVHTPRKIPVVLSPEEVARLIGAAGSLRNQTALAVSTLTLPVNMRGFMLPELEEFRSFPAQGPQGLHNSDINRRAAAIECYLDLNVGGYTRYLYRVGSMTQVIKRFGR